MREEHHEHFDAAFEDALDTSCHHRHPPIQQVSRFIVHLFRLFFSLLTYAHQLSSITLSLYRLHLQHHPSPLIPL